MATTTPQAALFISALEHAANHRTELTASVRCGCFFCFRMFSITDIRKWIDQNQTALCPRCGIDSVIGTASGHAIEDRFLRRLHEYRFGAGARAR